MCSSDLDYHQKVYRIRQGDVVAIPAGVSRWVLNDGNQHLVAIGVNDLNNQANQLDQSFRQFFLAGGFSSQGQQAPQNVLSGFDENLLADAFNVPVEIVRNMQQDQRGFIVNVRGGLSMIRPDEEEEQQQQGKQPNGLEESICTLRMKRNIDNRRDVEVYSRQAGRIVVANAQNLPVLNVVDMSAEKGTLKPNALYAPHWSSNAHSILYVISGDAQVQVVDDNGQTVLDQTVNQGDMFVIPQHYASAARAGRNGFEYVSIKTTSQPMQHPLVGQNSILRAMPLQVLTNAFGISLREAQNLKQARRHQTFLLSPTRSSSY